MMIHMGLTTRSGPISLKAPFVDKKQGRGGPSGNVQAKGYLRGQVDHFSGEEGFLGSVAGKALCLVVEVTREEA